MVILFRFHPGAETDSEVMAVGIGEVMAVGIGSARAL
jgi:hypothetical protein